MLFFSGFTRHASEIAGDLVKNIPAKTKQLERMLELLEEAIKVLCNEGDLLDFGRLLHESWMLKRSLSDRISTPAVDEIYERARKAGAIGGKVLAAGGGGFMLFFAPPDDPEKRSGPVNNR